MKVGVIDSGVEVAFLREHGLHLAGGASFTLDVDAGELETCVYEPEELEAWRRGGPALALEDTHGHGTAVLSLLYAAVEPWPPDVALYVARIFGEQVRASSVCLLEALRWMLDEVGVELLNLSLGTFEFALEAPLREVLERAVARGAVIVCAAGAEPTLPACLESVVAVGDTALLEHVEAQVRLDHVVRERTARVYGGGTWREVPMTTSFACAVVAGGLLRQG